MKHCKLLLAIIHYASPALVIIVSVNINQTRVFAAPCYPSDPDGNNPGNICPNTIQSSEFPNAFVYGAAQPVYTTPTVTNPAGTRLINPTGFWTEVQTTGSQRTMTTSTGESFTVTK